MDVRAAKYFGAKTYVFSQPEVVSRNDIRQTHTAGKAGSHQSS
jgi:hypothetical protein